jgi:hypothetical protein
VEKLIYDDWDGAWGDFVIDIDGANIESSGEVARFIADCTVKYSFEDADDKEAEGITEPSLLRIKWLALSNWKISSVKPHL